MNFQIVQQVAGREFAPALSRRNKPYIYSCPKKAARMAKRMTVVRGVKCQPRPIIENGDWRGREAARLLDGRYKPVLWAGQEWWDKNVNPDHFAHVGVKDPTKIAFIKNEKDGAADTQTAMKPGKYLTEFFGHVLTPEQITTYAMQHSCAFEDTELKFAVSVQEIERVYAAPLSDSCFSGTKRANLYGSGDFAVAYIEEGGKIKARSICAPERKIYCRPYGDSVRLGELLRGLGYEDATYKGRERWNGLRLLREHYWCNYYNDFGRAAKPHPTDDRYYVIY